jgi:hypothetical protein
METANFLSPRAPLAFTAFFAILQVLSHHARFTLHPLLIIYFILFFGTAEQRVQLRENNHGRIYEQSSVDIEVRFFFLAYFESLNLLSRILNKELNCVQTFCVPPRTLHFILL